MNEHGKGMRKVRGRSRGKESRGWCEGKERGRRGIGVGLNFSHNTNSKRVTFSKNAAVKML